MLTGIEALPVRRERRRLEAPPSLRSTLLAFVVNTV